MTPNRNFWKSLRLQVPWQRRQAWGNDAESQFLEKPAAARGGTIDYQPPGEDLAASLDAGLAPAFSEEQALVIGSANHSVLKSLSASIDSVPRINLRDADAKVEDPIQRPHSPEIPQRDSDSRYQLEGEIARGGMGAVLKGRDTDLGRDLAIKVLLDKHKDKPEVIARFVEEAQIGGQLQHPGIAPVYELGQFADKRPFFSMKLVKGKTLSALLAERKTMADDLAKLIGIFEQVCQTMGYAHSRGVIHRDLKPSNIMVGAFGEVQVMDWGLAKVLLSGGVTDEKKTRDRQSGQSVIRTQRSEGSGNTPEFGSHTEMGSVMGTPAYMPPEQALGEIDQLDQRADVFGLGAILCEILTGRPPYVGANSTAVFRLASRGKLADGFARLDQCGADQELIALTKHCLQAEPSDRPKDAAAVAERTTGYLESVQAKLKQAEIEAAEAQVRAESEQQQRELAEGKAAAEQKQRELAEQKATSERKRRQATLVMAMVAFLLIGSLGIGGYAAWQQRQMEEARYSAGIDRVYQLMEKYRYREAQAEVANLKKTLSFWVPQSSRSQLEETRKDVTLLLALDRVRQERMTLTEGKLGFARAAREYEKVFQDFEEQAGFKDSKAVVSDAMLNWLNSRPGAVSNQVLAALDDWAYCLTEAKQLEERKLVLAAVEHIDGDPARKKLRRQLLSGNPKNLDKLVANLNAKDYSASLLGWVAKSLHTWKGPQAGVEFLERVQADHPNDFWLCEQLLDLDNKHALIIKSQPNNPMQLLMFVAFCKQFKKQDPTAMKLVKTIEARFPTVKTWKGTVSTKQQEQAHQQKLQAGKTYLLEMQSKQFDTYLRLEDAKGKKLKENDDIAPNNLNLRIIFTPKQEGTYCIVATSYLQQGRGNYTIAVREFQISK